VNTSLLRLACTAALVTSAASAYAEPEVRDHREPAASPAPEVRDHRDDGAITTTRYRRRPGPRFMMPLKIDIGATGADTSRGLASGVAAAVGIHWASLSPTPTDTDIGIGVFGALLGAPKDPTMMSTDNAVAYGGFYLEGAHTLSRNGWGRTWASARGEYVGSSAFGETKGGFGASARLSAELYASGVGIEPRGLFLGTYAIGVYAEAGVRDMVADVGDFHVTAGLTFRTPLVIAP
jgi:hypothetical protein